MAYSWLRSRITLDLRIRCPLGGRIAENGNLFGSSRYPGSARAILPDCAGHSDIAKADCSKSALSAAAHTVDVQELFLSQANAGLD